MTSIYHKKLLRKANEKYWMFRLSEYSASPIQDKSVKPDAGLSSYKQERFQIPEDTALALSKVSKKKPTNILLLLKSALHVLIYKYTGLTKVSSSSISYDISREPEPLEKGRFFVESTIAGETSLRDLIKSVSEDLREAIQKQDYDYQAFYRKYEQEFQALAPSLNDTFLTYGPLQGTHDISTPYRLWFHIDRTEEDYELIIHYPEQAYSEDFVAQLSVHFSRILGKILKSPDTNIKDLALLTSEEEENLIASYSTYTAEPELIVPQETVISYFEKYAGLYSENTALIYRNKVLTYQELNEKAIEVASFLYGRQDFHSEEIIGVAIPKSDWAIVALLGIMRSGATYLPLDPKLTVNRQLTILRDCNCSTILISGEVLPDFEKVSGIEYIDISRDLHTIKPSQVPLPSQGQLAYILYTSGSTGRPKGVMIDHRSLFVKVFTITHFMHGTDFVSIQLANFAFDVSFFEIFSTLLHGGALVMPEDDRLHDFAYILNLVESHGVTDINTTPSYFASLIKGDAQWFTKTGSVRRLYVGGESLDAGLVAEIKGNSDIVINNHYGPTETTIDATAYQDVKTFDQNIIGRPVGGCSIYILDGSGQLVPPGIMGEIHIGGRSLARGYLNNPELTAQKFVLSSFPGDPVIYKTGDFGKWTFDGHILFNGRQDHQVQLRGLRIELEEISNTLLRHENVEDAIVLMKKDDRGQDVLVAYLVTANGKEQTEIIRAFLGEHLPSYMIPAHFVCMERFPLSVNDKKDLKALPEVSYRNPEQIVAAQSVKEKKLLKAFQETLAKSEIGLEANFFELGGDSIKAMQLASAVYREGYKVSVRDIFTRPVLKDLIKEASPAKAEHDQAYVTGTFPLNSVQKDFFESSYQHHHHFNQSVLLYSEKRIDEKMLQEALEEIQRHHDALRITFHQTENGYMQSNNLPADPVSLTICDVRDAEDPEEIISGQTQNLQTSINLEEAPLIKAAIFRMNQGDKLFLLVHHLVVDAVSWLIILEDLYYLYKNSLKGNSVSLPPKTASFKEWTETTYELLRSPLIAAEKEFWKRQINRKLPDLVAGVRSEVPDTYHEADSVSLRLDSQRTSVLQTSIKSSFNCGIDDLLLTAIILSCRDLFGTKQLWIELEGHGREEGYSLERTVGWFTRIYPALIEVSDSSDIATHIKSVKEQHLLFKSKSLSYDLLKNLDEDSALRGKDAINTQISLNYLGQLDVQSSLFQMEHKDVNTSMNLSMERDHVFEVNAMILNGELVLYFSYNRLQFEKQTIEKFIQIYYQHLEVITDACIHHVRNFSPSDFSFKSLSQSQVNELADTYRIKNIAGLSPMQEGMLYHKLISPDSQAYFEQVGVRIEGNIEVEIVRNTLKELTKKHDILKTIFVEVENTGYLQLVLEESEIKVNELDLRGYASEEEIEKTVEQYKQEDKKKLFPPDDDQVMMRLAVIHTDDNEAELIWSFHHMLLDGWCSVIFIEEFFSIYHALSTGKEITLQPVPPYTAFIDWINRQNPREADNYWQDYLSGYEEMATLERGSNLMSESYDNQELLFELGVSQVRALQQMASKYRCTINIILQALWGVLLAKFNNRKDVVFGKVVAVRPGDIPEIEHTLGLFINTIPVRVAFEADDAFHDLLARLQSASIDQDKYQYYSLAELQSNSKLEQDLFDHILIVENYPGDHLGGEDLVEDGSLRCTKFDTFEQTNYDLNLYIFPGEKLTLAFRFNANRYEKSYVRELAERFGSLMDQAIKFPATVIRELNIISDADREQIKAYNSTQLSVPADLTFIQLLETSFKANDGLIGLKFGDREFTYGELNRQSNRLAHYLKDTYDVGPGKVIALLSERSDQMLIAMLAVVKTGSAYLPVDPTFPENRIAYLLDDSQASLVIANQATREKVADKQALILEETDLSASSDQCLICPAKPEDQLYLMYTSGSTGRPKGVIITHSAVVNFMYAMQAIFKIGEGRDFLALTSITFDISVLEILFPLAFGGCVSLVSREEANDPVRLIRIIEKKQPEFIQATPTLWNLLIENGFTGNQGLTILTGGEELKQDLAEQLCKCAGGVYNMYGPTETTIWSSYVQVKIGEAVSLGTPIANTSIYILDEEMEWVPPGVEGEIYISGKGVAREYLNRPELNKKAFFQDPFEKANRMYRTGDLGFLKEGKIYYRGRADHQVKISGIRIDPGEIERVMESHAGVQQALVLKQTAESGSYLAGFFTGEAEGGIDSVRAHLAKYLPNSMIPSFLRSIPVFPTLASGKIDRSALPVSPGQLSDKKAVAGDEMERRMQLLWQEVLNVSGIGVEENFFKVGGHSLLAIRLLVLINETFDVSLSLPELLDAGNIRGLVDRIRGTSFTGSLKDEILLEAEGESGWDKFSPFPLSLIQQAYWVGRSTAFELGVRSMIHIEEKYRNLDFRLFTHSIRKLIGRHEMLRTTILADGQQQVMNYTPLYTPLFRDFSKENDAAAERKLKDLRESMWDKELNPGDWPFFDVAVVLESEANYRIVFMIDMIICDAHSLNLIQEELWAIYHSPDLKMEKISFNYRDYVLWEEQFRGTETYGKSKSYWQRRLKDFPEAPELPILHEGLSVAGDYTNFDQKLSVEEWQVITDLSAQYQVTLTAILLTLFSDVLGHWSSTDQFVINLTTFSRSPIHDDIDRLIGDFTGISLLEVNNNNSETFWGRVKIVQKQLWTDMEHRHYSGIEVIRDLAASEGHGAARMPVVFTSLLGMSESKNRGEGLAEMGRSRTSQVWIDHQVNEFAGELHYTWTVVEDLFPRGMMSAMFESYHHLLSTLAKGGEVKRLPVKAMAYKEYRQHNSDHLLSSIWHQANLHGDAEAIVNGSVRISYKQLWGMSLKLSGDISPANPVTGVVMGKGWEQIVAVLAILQSGSAYLPIDWSWPAERIKNLVRTVGIRQVVTQDVIYNEVDALLEGDIDVMKIGGELLTENYTSIRKGNWSDSSALAYVIFTSGSTGQPKGVMIDHKSAMNTIEDINMRFDVGSDDRVLGLSSLSFDLSVYDIFGVMGAGGTLILPCENLNVDEWKTLLTTEKVTIWNTVPSLMEILLDHEGTGSGLQENLRLVLLSGDWIPVTLPARIWKSHPDARVISLGGATECSIWSVFHEVNAENLYGKSIPYGKGLSNQWLYVYNSRLEECPEWTKGEIYIGGEGLARGYWADEEKTGSQFITHPVTQERLYRTGDRGRYLANGEIEFLGREDNQVKIGGYRIELGEVESTASEYPRVKDAVAVIYGKGDLRAIGACVILENSNDCQKFEGAERPSVRLPAPDNGKDDFAPDAYGISGGPRKKLSMIEFGKLLSVFSERSIQKNPLAKLRYPSAGSLYPVQIYLSIGSDAIEGLAAGHYYYARDEHQLKLLENLSGPLNGVSLFPVVYLPAIVPVYGIKSIDFSCLECGHMLSLFNNASVKMGYQLRELSQVPGIRTAKNSFHLDDQYLVLGGFSLKNQVDLEAGMMFQEKQNKEEATLPDFDEGTFDSYLFPSEGLLSFKLKKAGIRNFTASAIIDLHGRSAGEDDKVYLRRQSIRNFHWKTTGLRSLAGLLESMPDLNEQVGILVKVVPGMIEEMAGGLYRYRQSEQLLEAMPDEVPEALFGNANRELSVSGSFLILFVHHDGRRQGSLSIAGYMGQLLMEKAPACNLGLCPLGIDGDVTHIGKQGEVIYGFAGGRIESSQFSEWHPDVVPSLNDLILRQLRGFMQSRMPEYMLPGYYEPVENFPLTRNGKVDKKAIVELLQSRVKPDEGKIQEGRDEMEAKLLQMWRELLGHNLLGATDNLFEHGCNSLTALKALGTISNAFGIKLTLENIYENSTVEGLASVIKAIVWAGQGAGELDADMEETII